MRVTQPIPDALHHEGFDIFKFDDFPEYTREWVFARPLDFMRTQVEGLCAQLEARGPLASVNVVINSASRINAIVIPRKDFSVISLNAGALVRIRQMFHFAVSVEQVFPRRKNERLVADDECERFGVRPEILLQRVDLSLRARKASDQDYAHLFGPVPISVERFGLAQSLAVVAIDYIVMHEFAHIARNHVALSGGSRARPSFSEASRYTGALRTSIRKTKDLVWRQLLEIDADNMGADLSSSKFIAPQIVDPCWHGWARTPQQAFELWAFAVLMTFQLFSGSTHKGSWRHQSHPPPTPRLVVLLTALHAHLEQDNHLSKAAMLRATTAAMSKARRVWAHLGLPRRRSTLFANGEAVLPVANELVERYNEEMLPLIEDVHIWRPRGY